MGMSPYLKDLRERVGPRVLLLPSVAVLVWDPDDRLLMVQEAQTGLRIQSVVQSSPSEAPEDAAIREAEEEAGIRVQIDRVRAVVGGPRYRLQYPNGDLVSYVSIVYDARVLAGTAHPDSDETVAGILVFCQ